LKFKIAKCPVCGEMGEMVTTNNVLAQPICFRCVQKNLKYDNLQDANKFCRTYNIPFDPALWIKMAGTLKEKVFREYMAAQYGDGEKPAFTDPTTDEV
jgi:hypothetical protein